MATSIPGLSVSYLSDFDLQKPTKPGIPGLDVREGGAAMGELRNPNVGNGGVGSAEARSFRASLRQPAGIPGLDVIEGTPEQPRASLRQPAPSAGWLRRQASAVADAATETAGKARQSLGGVADDVSQAAGKVARRATQGVAEGAAYLDGALKPLASAPSEAKGLLRRGAEAVGEGTRRLAGRAGALGAAVDAAAGAKDVYDYAKTGASSGDVATRAAETAAGVGGAGAGAAAGAAAGAGLGLATGPFAPIASPLLGLAGGVAGAYVGKEGTQAAIRGLRSMVGLDEDPTRAQAQPRAPEIMMAPPAAGLRPTAAAPAAPQGPLTPTNAGADRDLTRELNAVPASLPTDMRPGIVAKTTGPGGRVTYSGTDVRENPSMVDGAGNNLTLRGSLTTLPGGPGSPGAASAALPAGGQGVATPEPTGGMTGFGSTGAGNMLGRSPEQQRRDAQTQASSIVASTRAQGLRSMETLDKQGLADTAADATRFTAQTSAEASKANARTAADASRYGADRQVDAAMASARGQGLRANLELQMKLQAQQAMAQAMRASGGDAAGALDTLLPAAAARRLVGARGLRAFGGLPGGAKLGLDLLGEGATETGQELGKQQVLGNLNPERDTSGDNMALADSFVGGVLGAGPISAASHAAAGGHRRAAGVVGELGDKAGQVFDTASGAAQDLGDAATEGSKGLFAKAMGLFNRKKGDAAGEDLGGQDLGGQADQPAARAPFQMDPKDRDPCAAA